MIIGITGINATDNPGPGIGVARSLKEHNMDWTIIGLSYDRNDPGHYMDFVFDKSFLLPFPSKGWEGIKNKLIKIKKEFGLDFIIPCLDAELPLFIKFKDELAGMGIHSFLPTDHQFEFRDKKRLDHLARTVGLHYPATFSLNSIEEMEQLVAQKRISFPFFVKGQYYKAYKVHDLELASSKFQEVAMEWGTPILLQESVHGEELNVVGVGDGLGGHLGILCAKKLTTTPLGKIWTGVSIRNQVLIDNTLKFLQGTKWRGPFELECIFNEDRNYLIEINPRFPAWTYFATGVGLNLPANIIRFIQNEEVPVHNHEYPMGKLFVRYTYELITDISKMGDLK